MSASDRLFAGSIPEIYDTYLVPLLFQPYAADMARRVAATAPRDVLEIAAGTGAVTRALLPLLDRAARYCASDLNQAMLDRAAAGQPSDERIEWRTADALNLPFRDARFDTVFCQFGVMFFPDKVAGYREALRVLRPGGRFIFSVWDDLQHNDLARTVAEALAILFPSDPPAFMARTPHGYHDSERIEADLRKAGFRTITLETLQHTSRAAKPSDPAVGFCQGTPLRNEIESRDANGLYTATEHCSRAIAAKYGPGPVSGKMQAHVVVASP